MMRECIKAKPARTWWPLASARLASRLNLFPEALENHHQESLDALPDAGILGFSVPRDVQALDLGIPAEPFNHVRRKNDFARCDQHHGLSQSLTRLEGRLGSRSVRRAELMRSIALLNVLDGPCGIALGWHLPSTVDVREPARWALFGLESKRHPPARGNAASLCCAPSSLVGARLSTGDNDH